MNERDTMKTQARPRNVIVNYKRHDKTESFLFYMMPPTDTDSMVAQVEGFNRGDPQFVQEASDMVAWKHLTCDCEVEIPEVDNLPFAQYQFDKKKKIATVPLQGGGSLKVWLELDDRP